MKSDLPNVDTKSCKVRPQVKRKEGKEMSLAALRALRQHVVGVGPRAHNHGFAFLARGAVARPAPRSELVDRGAFIED